MLELVLTPTAMSAWKFNSESLLPTGAIFYWVRNRKVKSSVGERKPNSTLLKMWIPAELQLDVSG